MEWKRGGVGEGGSGSSRAYEGFLQFKGAGFLSPKHLGPLGMYELTSDGLETCLQRVVICNSKVH